ncbi:MAG TPA: 2-succinyl-5-enolpyruvyl-6-hydroxy-3-cyclohexene-1-carboxylic-acid synthase, partial [Propionibacteriaceae bacterium]|nr:2-succinyl-5-enolpyruvyl-6-hydroxy-3-cyclohexene-1-carboxylic-acid synthase [Propionibacteriaceae bacterium]
TCARVIIGELISRGVRDVVLAPGARSAPLAYECLEADRIGLLRLHVRIDERTAGFLGLGLAKGSGAPVAVLTTSGTATANLHPAVLEAWHAHVPLIVITASRPRSVINTGSNQTTDQDQLFGRQVRGFAALSDEVLDHRTWRFEIARIVTAATGSRTRTPGPVQLNVELSEPLVPAESAWPPPAPELTITSSDSHAEPMALSDGAQTVIVAGDCRPDVGAGVADLAAEAAVPLLAEPSSNARGGEAALSTYRLLLSATLAEEIERVVVFGRPTLSRPVTQLLSRDDIELVVVSAYADWIDPGRAASLVTDAVRLPDPRDRGWLEAWREADRVVRVRLDALLAAQPYFTGPGLAAAVWSALDADDVLFAGSSSPIRDLDIAPVNPAPPKVYANRGLSGIDGNVSTAAGLALALERPTHALIGDLTALHDATGLVIGREEPRPDLRLVVANDDGGSFFATLEQGLPAHMGAFERLFGTPVGLQFEALATAAAIGYRRVQTADDLAEVLAEPPVGVELVDAVIDRAHRRTLDRQITALAATL